MSHLGPEELSATLDGALADEARARAKRHLAECASCREALAALEAQDETLRSVLQHDPGEAYFETFAARVEDRIRAAGLTGAQARLDREGFWGWLSSPRRLAWAGAVTAVIAGAGIVMLTTRQQRPVLENPEIAQRSAPATEGLASGTKKEQERTYSERAPVDQKLGAAPEAKRDEIVTRLSEPDAARQAPGMVSEERAEKTSKALVSGSSSDAAPPARAQEVRRTASGEDVPVAGPSAPFAAAPPKTSGSTGNVAGAKRAASPMEVQSSARSLAPTAQTKDGSATTTFCGRVVDARQRPVAGATVALADQGLVTNAAADGRFCFEAAAGLHELSVMAVGYEPTRLQVRVEGESSEALVSLRPVTVLGGSLAKGAVKPSAGSEAITVSPQGAALNSAPPPSAPAGDRDETTYGYLQQPGSAKANATLERARTASRTAESAGTAAAYDAAAAAWAKVVPIATSGAPRNDALYSVAEARFRAFQIAPTSSRTKSARSAIDAFLKAEPAGARKDRVTGWRAQLPR